MELDKICHGFALLLLEHVDLSRGKFLGIWAFPLLPGAIFELAALPPGILRCRIHSQHVFNMLVCS